MSDFVCEFGLINIPSDFIENIMPQANGAFVKVYLYSIYLAQTRQACSFGEIASKLELLESDVINALTYLNDHNALSFDGNKVIFGSDSRALDSKIALSKPELNLSNTSSNSKKSFETVKQIMSDNEALSDLCLLSQQILDRTLSNSDIETLYWFYDELGFSPEVIMMLLEYCVSIDKRNMKYIEKVAISWHENGITTMDAAQNYMDEKKEKNSYVYNLRRLFGIDNRNLSKTEEMYFKTWHEIYGMSEEMTALAYEYCIISTGKLSFPYMNTIIENWYKKNIFTIEDAERDHNDYKQASINKKELSVYEDRSGFDYDDIEKIMQEKYDK